MGNRGEENASAKLHRREDFPTDQALETVRRRNEPSSPPNYTYLLGLFYMERNVLKC